jgi:hypothetical protein
MTGVIDKLWERCAAGRAPSGPSTDVLRQVIKVAALSVALTARPGAALPDRATRDRAANRLTGD